MRTELLPRNAAYYRTNLHCHTTLSDGKKTPEQIKADYLAHGYSVVAFTDHDKYYCHNDLTDSRFVADFMGNPSMNFTDGALENGRIRFGGISAAFESEDGNPVPKEFVVGIRPEYVSLNDHGAYTGKVYSTLPSGMETTVKIETGGALLTAVVFGDVDWPVDTEVRFDFTKTAILFDRESGDRISRGRLI